MPKESVAQHKNASRELGEAPSDVQPTMSARESEEVSRARSIVCGAETKPAVGKWRFYKQYDWLPNYYGIETSDYTDSGFNLTGYIHEKDARRIAAVPAMEAALEEALEYFEDRSDVVDGDYGAPAANREMQMVKIIKEALGKGGY